MTTRDAGDCLAYLLAAYPSATLEEASMEVYVDQLKRLDDPDVAKETALLLIENVPQFPSIADFRREYFAIRRRKAEADAREEFDADYVPVPPPDYALEFMRSLGMETDDGPTPEAEVETLLPEPPGRCDDCGSHSSDGGIDAGRFRYGKFALCRVCATRRMRVKLAPVGETVHDEVWGDRKEEPVEQEPDVRKEV